MMLLKIKEAVTGLNLTRAWNHSRKMENKNLGDSVLRKLILSKLITYLQILFQLKDRNPDWNNVKYRTDAPGIHL